jgi:predicted dehydrogenase
MNIAASIRKVIRYTSIYGPGRTWFKAAGRLGVGARVPRLTPAKADVGVIGCGQFAFASIGYFLRRQVHALGTCYDINPKAQDRFARALGVRATPRSFEDFLAYPDLRTVYIASNHASHATYAIQTLAHGIDTYIEKPVAVNQMQLVALLKAKNQSKARVFAGYNRPFSGAIQLLHRRMTVDPAKGITLQCFVSGHAIPADNWYRRPEEGSRVCGNVGHWLDLFVHILSWRGMPDMVEITLNIADTAHPDDNLAIGITSDRGDLFSVMLSTRADPFEGVNESINLQHHDTIAKIDDFRRMTIWQGERLIRKRFWPKDVGHQGAILQPFRADPVRDWNEVVQSTQLMLHIADMLRAGLRQSAFSFRDHAERLTREVEVA